MLNKVTIIGRVGKEPEIKTMQSGDRVCNLSVASSEKYKDKKTGESKENTEWHNVVVFNQPLVNLIDNYVSKGDLLYLQGKIQTRKWQDKTGADRYSTEVVLSPFNSEIKLLQTKGKEKADEYKDSFHNPPRSPEPSNNDMESDEIPF